MIWANSFRLASAASVLNSILLTVALWAGSLTAADAEFACAGRWRVAIYTSIGACEPHERSRSIIVKDSGQVGLAKLSSHFSLSGSVSACDRVSLVITRGPEIARGSGRITGNTAKGEWNVVAPANKRCSGTWVAEKRHGRDDTDD